MLDTQECQILLRPQHCQVGHPSKAKPTELGHGRIASKGTARMQLERARMTRDAEHREKQAQIRLMSLPRTKEQKVQRRGGTVNTRRPGSSRTGQPRLDAPSRWCTYGHPSRGPGPPEPPVASPTPASPRLPTAGRGRRARRSAQCSTRSDALSSSAPTPWRAFGWCATSFSSRRSPPVPMLRAWPPDPRQATWPEKRRSLAQLGAARSLTRASLCLA